LFSFSYYLNQSCDKELNAAVNVGPWTWFTVLLLLLPLRFFVRIDSFAVRLAIMVGLSFLMLFVTLICIWKLRHMRNQIHGVPRLDSRNLDIHLRPIHEIMEESRCSLFEAFLRADPPYKLADAMDTRRKPVPARAEQDGMPNAQEKLFWFAQKGPTYMLVLLRSLLFYTAIYIAACITGEFQVAYSIHPVLVLLHVISPIYCLFSLFMNFLNELCICKSVGEMQHDAALKAAIAEAKRLKIVHTLKLLRRMRLAVAEKDPGQTEKEAIRAGGLNYIKFQELHDMFNVADADRSGMLSGDECRALIESRPEIPHKKLQLESIDPEWSLNYESFSALFYDISEVQQDHLNETHMEENGELIKHPCTLEEKVRALVGTVFELIDEDGSGEISSDEILDMIKRSPQPVSDADVLAVQLIFRCVDKDGSGLVSVDELGDFLVQYSSVAAFEDYEDACRRHAEHDDGEEEDEEEGEEDEDGEDEEG
jgi:Ca2+-binding EF-hand superfamily protein